MNKINKEYFWLLYLAAISVLGILLLTGHLDIPSVRRNSAEVTNIDEGTSVIAYDRQETTVEEAGEETVGGVEEETENADVNVLDNFETEEDSLEARYNQLEKEITEKENLLAEYQEQIALEEESKYAILKEYGEQMQGVSYRYRSMVNYTVNNFSAQADIGGTQNIERVKKADYAIGELSKYTPWGITINLFSSMAMDSRDQEYSIMVKANNALGTGMQNVIVDTKASVEEFEGRLNFFETLTEDSDRTNFSGYTEERLRTIWENQYLIKYALNGHEIDLEPYAVEVRKKLYILGAATQVLKDYYDTLLMGSSFKTQNQNQLQAQYDEIMKVIDPEGTGEISAMVTPGELGKYLIPLIDAGMSAADAYTATETYSPNATRTFSYSSSGRIYYHYKSSLTLISNDRNSRGSVAIYYAGERMPVYVDGYYFYHGTLLNGGDNADGTGLYNAAIEMTSARGSRTKLEQTLQNLADESRKLELQ